MSKAITSTEGPHPGVPTYRAFHTNTSGGISSAEVIDAGSDDEAKDKASKMINGRGIDLWQRTRFLASFPPLGATEVD